MNREEFILNLIMLGLKEDESAYGQIAAQEDENYNGFRSFKGNLFTIDIINSNKTKASIYIPRDMSDTLKGGYLQGAGGNEDFSFEHVLSYVGMMYEH